MTEARADSVTIEGEKISSPATPYITTTSTLFSDMQLLAKNVSKDPAIQVTVPNHAYSESAPPSSQRYLQVEEPSDQLMPFVGGWIRLLYTCDYRRNLGISTTV